MTGGLFRDTDYKTAAFRSVSLIMFLFFTKTQIWIFFIERVLTWNILQLLTGLLFDICYGTKTRLGFEIAEMTRFLNYISSYSFALKNS